MQPLVSIVMPSLNQGRFISEAIQSVLTQSYTHVELIVADGGSMDGTLDVLNDMSRCDERLHWFSESDTGPANAINKALKRVHGTIIGWLNADDLYVKDAIVRAVNALSTGLGRLMVYGHGHHLDEHGEIINDYPTRKPDTPSAIFQHGCFICQPTVFFTRTLYLMLGDLDETLQTAFDFDYWLRAFTHVQRRIGFVDDVQAHSRLHKDCITLQQRDIITLEGMRVIKRHLGFAPLHWFLTYMDECIKDCKNNQTSHALNLMFQNTLANAKPFLNKAEFYFLNERIQSWSRANS